MLSDIGVLTSNIYLFDLKDNEILKISEHG